MSFRPLRNSFSLLFILGLLLSACSPSSPAQSPADQNYIFGNPQATVTGVIYSQPVDPNGKLLLSAWLDPDGSNVDQYIWDNFTLPSDETITDIEWYGVYDPMKFGAGGPVVDFSVSIYPSIAAGTEPALAYPPLRKYQTGGNAGETPIGAVAGTTLYSYSINLATPFMASAGVKYWVQIEAFQHGTIPDWCFAAGSNGDGSHFERVAGAGGDIRYRFGTGDAAFTLFGPVTDVPTPTDTPTEPPAPAATDTPTSTPTDTAVPTFTDTPTSTTAPTFTATPTFTPTNTPENTATNTPTQAALSTPTNTPTELAIATATSTTVVDTPTPTSSSTPTEIPTNTPTNIPTATPTPLPNVPGKVTGGGNLDWAGGKATFGFVVQYDAGSANPSGNLTFIDHTQKLTLKASSFTILSIDGNHSRITGLATVNGVSNVIFILDLYDNGEPGSSDQILIQIPEFNNYSAGGGISGGNIKISTP